MRRKTCFAYFLEHQVPNYFTVLNCRGQLLVITKILASIPKEEYQKTFQKWVERMELKIMENILNI